MKLKQYLQKLKKNKNSDFIEYEYFEEMLLESDLGPKLTIEIIEEISLGIAPPLVSHKTTHSAPASAATEITSIAYSGFFL